MFFQHLKHTSIFRTLLILHSTIYITHVRYRVVGSSHLVARWIPWSRHLWWRCWWQAWPFSVHGGRCIPSSVVIMVVWWPRWQLQTITLWAIVSLFWWLGLWPYQLHGRCRQGRLTWKVSILKLDKYYNHATKNFTFLHWPIHITHI